MLWEVIRSLVLTSFSLVVVVGKFRTDDIEPWSAKAVLAEMFPDASPSITGSCTLDFDISAEHLLHVKNGTENEYGAYQHWARARGLAPFIADVATSSQSSGCTGVFGQDGKNMLVGLNNVTEVVFSLPGDNNIFHQLILNPVAFCCAAMKKRHPEVDISLASPTSGYNAAQSWMKFVLENACITMNKTISKSTGVAAVTRSDGDVLISYDRFLLNGGYVQDLIRLRHMLRSSIVGSTIPEPTNSVVILLRSPRTLVDSVTFTTNAVISEICDKLLGRRVEVRDIGRLDPRDQARLMARASVVVSVHGADLTNMIWMPPCASIIEVTLRHGWCCDPIPLNNLDIQDPKPCTECTAATSQGCPDNLGPDKCKGYHKADYANLASALNLTYVYFDPEQQDPPFNVNPISRKRVYVDAKKLAAVVAEVFHRTQHRACIEDV